MIGRWYKRSGRAFIDGTMGLSLEEKGAYSLCLDLIYDHGGPIADDGRWIAAICGCSVRKWSGIRERLIAAGKLTSANGRLSNSRADEQIVSAESQRRKQAESGARGGRARAINEQERQKSAEKGQATLKPIEESREERTVSNDTDGEPSRVTEVDPVKVLWDEGVALLTATGSTASQARSWLGKSRKDHGDGRTLQAVRAARNGAITAPIPWMTKFLANDGRGSADAQRRALLDQADRYSPRPS